MKENDTGGIRCSEVLAKLSTYVDGELETPDVTRIEAHLAGCPDCERFGRGFGEMLVALRNTDEPDADAVETALKNVTAKLAE